MEGDFSRRGLLSGAAAGLITASSAFDVDLPRAALADGARDSGDQRTSGCGSSANPGFTLIRHQPPATGTFARTAAQRIFAGIGDDGTYVNDWINPDYDEAISNEVGNLDIDLSDAFHAAFDAAYQGTKGMRTGAAMIAPGRYTVGKTIETAYPRLLVIGVGRVVLQQMKSFTDPLLGVDDEITRPRILSCDGRKDGIYRHYIDNIVIRGNGGVADAFFDRKTYNSFRRFAARNIGGAAYIVLSGVLNSYDLFCNYRGEGLGNEVVPKWGLIVDKSDTGGKTTQCSFDVRIEEASFCGIWLKNADTCGYTGTAEGLSGSGIIIESGSLRNVFTRFYCEKNGGLDWEISGNENILKDQCSSYNEFSSTSISIRSGAERNIIRDSGNKHTVIEIAAGALDTILENVICRRLINNAGNFTHILGYFLDVTESSSTRIGDQGVFEPHFGGSSSDGTIEYVEQSGQYSIVNNLCFFGLRLSIGSILSQPDGFLLIKGLPFTSLRSNAAASIADLGKIRLPATTQIVATVKKGSREISLQTISSDNETTPILAAALRSGSIIELSGFFPIS